MTARSVRLLPFAFACLLAALAGPAQAGTPDAPEVVDADDDARLAPLDIAAVWFDANDTHLVVHIERAATSDSPTPVVCEAGHCAGTGIALRVVFTSLDPLGLPTPALESYASSYVLVRLGPDDANLTAVQGFYDGNGTGTLLGPVNATINGTSIAVAVPRAGAALALPEGPTPGPYRITQPYALSYLMECAPADGCRTQGAPPVEQLASAWDRAPDAEFGLDYVFASPAGPTEAPVLDQTTVTTTSTTTVTVVQKLTSTTTVTEESTVTHIPLPIHVEGKATPGLGMVLAAGGLVASLALRRRLA